MPRSLNVLIVEDSRHDAELVADELRNAGFDPHWKRVETEDAYRASLQDSPDLIISDLWMPEPMGFLDEQRLATLGLAGVPVIYLTASKKEDLRQIAHEEGAFAFFEKPYDAEELLSAVSSALSATSVTCVAA